MKSNKLRNKILSAFAVLAVSVTTVCGAVSLAGCSDKTANLKSENAVNSETTKITTAVGVVESRSSGKTYYVSPDGKNDGDGSESSPKSILFLNGLNALQPGDTVLVKPGVYKLAEDNANERIVIQFSGAYNNYITIKNADPSKQCVIDFSAQEFNSLNRGVSLNGSYIYWNGIDICGAGDNGLYIGGSYNTVEYCEFYNCRDTGLQLGRGNGDFNTIDQWPSYNLVKNCTSHNNYDNESYGENADGFAAKLTVGYGNVFDGCIAYRNSDDGWDLYAKTESGNIGAVIIYNCVAYDNGYLEYTQQENNARYKRWRSQYAEVNAKTDNGATDGGATDGAEEAAPVQTANEFGRQSYLTRDGDGNGFKLGGSVMEGDVVLYNCLAFNNRMHGVTDNSNPGVLSIEGVTSYNNSAKVDEDPSSQYFGKILDVANHDTHANIDVARQTYSYNNLSHVLSVKDELALSLSTDAYRASVVDSILLSKKIEGCLDADTKNPDGATGDNFKPAHSTEIFAKLPFTKQGEGETATYTFNVNGLNDLYSDETETSLNPNRAHKIYRNADGSVNMGDILAVKDYGKLLGESNKIGCVLNLKNYGEYTHFFAEDFTNGTAGSENAAIVARTKEALTINCDLDAVYQDFDIPSKMVSCNIEWTSSNEEYLTIGTEKDISLSKSEYIRAIVNHPTDKDVPVTLTAKITCGDSSATKEFNLTIKAGKPKIGNIFVQTSDGNYINDEGVLILDHYTIFTEPKVFVENGIDYNGKLLSEDMYEVTTTYKYTSDKNVIGTTIANFTPSNAGVYTVTKTITMKDDPSQFKSMSYTVYVASPYADVDFIGDASIVVNRHGYVISGEMSNATGAVYAVSSPTELNLTEENKESIKTTAGVKSYQFRGDNISFQFDNDNNNEYFLYYVVTNFNDEIKSKLYSTKINVVNISTAEDFMKIAGGEPLDTEVPASTIYKLTADIDCAGVNWTIGKEAFRGLLNGNGHTVSNLTVNGADKADNTGVFYKVDGGTVMNIKFNNINIIGYKSKVGIVSECTGGYFYNIQITDINVEAEDQRAGGLIGCAAIGTPIYIEQVSIVNDNKDYKIKAGQRAGGIVGFSQAGKDNMSGNISVYINNCLVNANIEANYELGGIYGTYDCGNNLNCSYYLSITHCVFMGTVTATGTKTYSAGILGYEKGAYAAMEIKNCLSIGKLYFNGDEVATSLKNCSGIVGSSGTLIDGLEADVDKCFAMMEEHNSNFNVSAWTSSTLQFALNFTQTAGLSEERWTLVIDESIPEDKYGKRVKAPYVTLNFLGDWNTAE